MTLREQLQAALGSAYTIQRELGGGGMSRVFVARDEGLGRDVVVKVLPPELLAGVSAERFDREIRLAAGLQHPHIVPVLHAGQTDGVPYYTMPFVEGASLRDRLTRDGTLSIAEAVSVLRDVARALAYAHDRGVVHRDIKPDNVLLSGGSAVVTDFGIAKAISAARTGAPGERLTQVGVSIGTPAYMAPEQAAADPAMDHRADIYAFGCLAYELLTGRAPFVAKSPQMLLAAHLSLRPEPVQSRRPETPGLLAELVAACLEKDPDARPQRATEILRRLDAAASGGTDSVPLLLARGRGMLVRALAVYAIAFAVVAVLAKLAISAIGLPDWVFPGALILMALGLPVVLFTAYMHRVARALSSRDGDSIRQPTGRRSGTMAEIAARAQPHWSWRRTAIGGALAVGAFTLLVAGYMVLRATGIGPAGSLLAAGTLEEHDRILVADLEGPPADSGLGAVVSEVLRTALGESRSVQVLQPSVVQDALRRMQRQPQTRVDLVLAKEIAEREGASAILDGRLLEVGGRYVLSLRLSTRTGDELATFRETADGKSGLVPIVDRLAKQIRGKIGESLRTVQRTPPLAHVTTSSLEALRKYVESERIFVEQGLVGRVVTLLEEATQLDTGFAMAHSRLAARYLNLGQYDRSAEALDRAFANRHRLTDEELYFLLGRYYSLGRNQDEVKAQEAFERLLAQQPNNLGALNGLARLYFDSQDFAKGESLLVQALQRNEARPLLLSNLVITRIALGKLDSAMAAAEQLVSRLPNNSVGRARQLDVLWARGQYDSVAPLARELRAAGDATAREWATTALGALALLHGRLTEADRYARQASEEAAKSGDPSAVVHARLQHALIVAVLSRDRAGAARSIDEALDPVRPDTLPILSRSEYELAITGYGLAGATARARKLLDAWQTDKRHSKGMSDSSATDRMKGYLALSSGQPMEAARLFRIGARRSCRTCIAPMEGRAWDLAGQPDSAIAAFEYFVTHSEIASRRLDGLFLPPVHKRLGELYEAKGQRERALRHYRTFIELWKNADPELQPQVTDARRRVAALTRGTDTR